MARISEFQTIRSEGGLLPSDLLRRVIDPRAKLEGTTPEAYGLPQGERLNEVITQSWNRLCRHWAEFRNIAENLPAGEAATGLTNDKWTLPLLRELGFGTLPTSAAPEIEGRSYPIARFHGPVPLHLVGCGLNLDRRTAGARGAASSNPHGMVQEFLNRSRGHLWAIVSNGRQLRVLRDNQALSRQSFIEFDLEAMFNGQVYADFVLMWMIAHVSRFLPREGDKAESCLLERWTKIADEEGTRALGELRGSVAKALQVLGAGFTGNPRNTALHTALSTNHLTPAELHAELLRVVYRLIFLFVAEDRQIEGQPLLHPRDKSDAARIARERYVEHYGTARLRELAGSIRGSRHGDLWRQFKLLAKLLSDDPKLDTARSALALPVLGGFLWNESATPHLNDAELTNHDFLEVLRHLAFTRQGKALRSVDFRNLGAEELGGVYETLLELTPQVSGGGRKFEFAEFAGNERKTSGSYYTPDSLVQCLLDTALDPVVNEVIAGKAPREAEAAILNLKICDPAVGSGHFLVGAAHRMARHLARVRSLAEGESEPSPLHYQHALRDVIGRCLYGVDINPMSAELCRVGLWLEAMEPGKPLSFLDHHIRVGNSLLGATPELITAGLPDEAFTAIEGDDKAACTELKKLNKGARKSAGPLFAAGHTEKVSKLAQAAANVAEMPDDRPEDIRAKERAHRLNEETAEFKRAKLISDAWCAAFVYEKTMSPAPAGSVGRGRADGIVQAHILDLANGGELSGEYQAAVERLAAQYKFFHWHLVFPEVFHHGGFDCVLGNPPWDTLSPDQREFFGRWVSGLRSMAPEAQQARIDRLLAESEIADQWRAHCRDLFALVHFLKNSGRFTLFSTGNLGKGDFNVYRMFTELALRCVRHRGAVALVLPGGIYGGANASRIRKFILDECELKHLWGLINTRRGWFEKVDIDRFAAVAIRQGGRTKTFLSNFGMMEPADLDSEPVEFDADMIRENAPETYAIPDVRNLSELTTSRKMYAACPPFGECFPGSPLRHYSREVDMGNDRGRFSKDPAGLPVYEGRMISNFDHRAKTYQSGHGNSAVWIEREFGDPDKAIVPQWRVLRENIPAKLGARCDRYRIGFGDVANPRNERSLAAALIPPGTICGHKVPTFIFDAAHEWAYLPWLAVANSFTMDWLARTRLSAPTMSYTLLDSMPFPRPALADEFVQGVAPLVLRLICTASEMTGYWNSMAAMGLCESVAESAVPATALVEPSTRAAARATLDAYIAAQVFGLARQELADLLDTFEVLRRREVRICGEFCTKRLIMESFATLE